MADKKNYLKVATVFILCLLMRLIPFRAPNIEPILSATMPFSKIFGSFFVSAFAVLSILFYDMLTGTLGVQTFFTVFAYGVLGFWSFNYFKNKEANSLNFVRFSIMGTLFFDAFTGLTVGPIFFHQSFVGSLLGQIPFTILHLVGNVIFAITLSPAIYHFMIKKKIDIPIGLEKESLPIINVSNLKII